MAQSYSRKYICTSNDNSKYLPILVQMKPMDTYLFLKPIISKKYPNVFCNDDYCDIHIQDGKFEYSFVFNENEKKQTEIDIGVYYPSIFKKRLKHFTLNSLVEEYTNIMKDYIAK